VRAALLKWRVKEVTEEEPMITESKLRVIAIEEHYYDKELAALFTGLDGRTGGKLRERLEDVSAPRLKEMDEAGVDMQVLSHGAPSTQKLDAQSAAIVTRGVNDRLRDIVKAHPERFAAFAALPTADPKAAASELSRAVNELGFKGAMIHGLTGGTQFIDDERFWPIFAQAHELDVPIYLHPANPHPAIIDTYLKPYSEKFPALVGPSWGFTIETATAGIRMVLSGVFEKYPRLKIILGHLGETLPFLVWRIDHTLSRPGNAPNRFRETFCNHFYVTTSGFFSDPAMLCCMQEMGIDRILFAVDWPFVDSSRLGTQWMERIMLSTEDKAKVLNGNAARLLKM
jgi:predicted TIM-barrel fold metal-dependent hydrolase